MRNATKRSTAAASRSVVALILALCLLMSSLPAALAATRAGMSSSALVTSATKKYALLSRSVLLFTGETYGEGSSFKAEAGTVLQLFTDDWYTGDDGLNYYSVYCNGRRYNALRTEVVNDVLSSGSLETYITGTLWNKASYDTLRYTDGLVGDIRVHAVQLALQKLGYYTGSLDGSYGKSTMEAVKRFQKANGLDDDGNAGPLTQPVLFALASGGSAGGGSSSGGSSSSSSSSGSSSSSSSSSSAGTVPTAGSLTTTVSVNLRKSYSTSTARLAVVPASTTLNYTDTAVRSGVTWYQVTYNSITGWLMGTYVTSKGSSASPAIGTVTITKGGTRVRDAANGNKTGYVLAKGTVVDLLAQPTSAGGYTWYNIRTGTGLVGFVRGDCASASIGGSTSGSAGSGSSSDLVVSTDKTFVRLPANTNLFLTSTYSTGVAVSSGTVLMMVSPDTYTSGGTEYCSLYYNNKKYNAVYADVKNGIMSSAELTSYCNSLLSSSLASSLKSTLGLTGDVRVYTLQAALKSLGYYTGALDGTYGSGTVSAVRNFQRSASISVDGACGNETWAALNARLNGSTSTGGSTSGSTGSSVTVTDFGTVSRVVKASWDYDDAGANLIPKGSYATVMDIETGKVFKIYRWSGAYHADCVPASAADTRIMCEIVGFPYNSNHPTSSQLEKIKADGDKSTVTYTWPDFKNAFGGAKNIGSAWDARAALVNVNGTVYPVGIYGFPHGFNGTDSFSKSKFPSGQYFYAANNYYGMMCLHFVGSQTHSGNVSQSRQDALNKAWSYAQSKWPSLCK